MRGCIYIAEVCMYIANDFLESIILEVSTALSGAIENNVYIKPHLKGYINFIVLKKIYR